MNTPAFTDLKDYVTSDERVCPNPVAWNNLCKMLRREATRRNISEKIQNPLILAGWVASTDASKREVFIEHIYYSEKHGFLEKIDRFLRSLPDEDWHRCPEQLLHAPSGMELEMQDWQEMQEIVLEAKKYHAELVKIDENLIYDEENFASHISSFSGIFAEAINDIPKSIETLQIQLEKYEELKFLIDKFDETFWNKKILSMKTDILKLKICECCKSHEARGGDGIYDFCDQFFSIEDD